MVTGIQGFKMKEAVSHKEKVFMRSFPRANIDAMNSYVCLTMQKSPSRIKIHGGTNDLHTQQSPWTLHKAFMLRNRLNNKYNKNKTDEN